MPQKRRQRRKAPKQQARGQAQHAASVVRHVGQLFADEEEDEFVGGPPIPLSSLEESTVTSFLDSPGGAHPHSSKKSRKRKSSGLDATPPAGEKEGLTKKGKKGGEDDSRKVEMRVWKKFDGLVNKSFKEFYSAQLHDSPEKELLAFFSSLTEPLNVTFRVSRASEFKEVLLERLYDFRGTLPQKLRLSKFEELYADFTLRELNVMTEAEKDSSPLIWQVGTDRMGLKKCEDLQPLREFLSEWTDRGDIVRQDLGAMLPALFLDLEDAQEILELGATTVANTRLLIELTEGGERGQRSGTDTGKGSAIAAFFGSSKLGHQVLQAHGSVYSRPNVMVMAQTALSLHSSQIESALRGIELLSESGQMVYATHSLNPVENEAVVAELLRRTGRSLELLDVSQRYPNVGRAQGLKTWKVFNKEMKELPTVTDDLPASLWPPQTGEEFPLERCVRIYPHKESIGPKRPDGKEQRGNKKDKEQQNALVTLPSDKWRSLSDFYGLASKSSPAADGKSLPFTLLWKHDASPGSQTVSLVTPAVAALVEHLGRGVAVLHSGVPVLKPHGKIVQVPCEFGPTLEGAHYMLPHCKERLFALPLKEFCLFLGKKELWLKSLKGEVGKNLVSLSEGPLLIFLEEEDPVQTMNNYFSVPAWKGRSSISITLSEQQRKRMERDLTMMKRYVEEQRDDEEMEDDES